MPRHESMYLPALRAHLKDFIILAQAVEKEFRTKCSVETNEKERNNNFFVYHFLHRTILYSQSIQLLAENGFCHEAILVARTILEGVINFEYYRDYHDIADKWRLFMVYEDGKKVANTVSLAAKHKWLYEKVEHKFGADMVDRAEKDFGFNYLPRESLTFSKMSLSDLINRISDTKLRRQIRDQYDVIYNEFSQIAHWSPSGVIEGDFNAVAAVNVAIDALYEISKEADKKYELGHNKDLNKLKIEAIKALP